MRKLNVFGKIGIKINQVCKYIGHADDFEIQQIMQAVEQRYTTLYPDWDVVYIAVHKEPKQRTVDLQNILAMLKKEETDSLG